jgi:hypothetical protein
MLFRRLPGYPADSRDTSKLGIQVLRLMYYVAMATGIWLGLSYLGPTEKYKRLVQAGAAAQATVVKQDCGNHGTFVYRFDVTGRRIESRDHASSMGRRCDELKPDEVVNIIYLPIDPSVNTVGSPREELREERQSVGLAAIVLPGVIIWAITRRRRKQTDA